MTLTHTPTFKVCKFTSDKDDTILLPSCSSGISRLNIATVCLFWMVWVAIFMEKLVFPVPGVPAITMKSNGEEYILWKLK